MKKRPGLVHLRKLDLIFHVDLQIKQIEKVCLRFGMPIRYTQRSLHKISFWTKILNWEWTLLTDNQYKVVVVAIKIFLILVSSLMPTSVTRFWNKK